MQRRPLRKSWTRKRIRRVRINIEFVRHFELTPISFTTLCACIAGKVQAYRNEEDEDSDDDDEYDEEEEEEDLDYASYSMSRMSIGDDDEITMDTRGKSVSFGSVVKKKSITKVGAAIGKMKGVDIVAALPYIIDYWYDMSPQQRASIQIQMLSGDAMQLQRVSYRVSSAGNEFVLLIPKSRFMGEPKAAFETYVLNGVDDKESHEKILNYHPKSVARRLQLADIQKNGNVLEFRIPLAKKFSLNFATVANNDPYFYGDKFVNYPDGSCHLHVELVSEDDKHTSSTTKGAAPIFYVPGSVSVPSLGGDDDCSCMSISSRSVKTSNTRKSVATSRSIKSNRSIKSARTAPIIDASPAPAGKYRKGNNGERVRKIPPLPDSTDATI